MNDTVVAVHPVGERAHIAAVELNALSGARVLVCIRQSLNTKVTFSRLMERLEHSGVTPRPFALL